MKKKVLIFIAILAFSLMFTPIALAKPATEKNNEKFEYFKLEFNGVEGSTEREWNSPPTGMPALLFRSACIVAKI